MCPNLDYDNNQHINNFKAKDTIIQTMQKLKLIDVYWEQHADTRRCTWRKANSRKPPKLDVSCVRKWMTNDNDHPMPVIKLKFNELKKEKVCGNSTIILRRWLWVLRTGTKTVLTPCMKTYNLF